MWFIRKYGVKDTYMVSISDVGDEFDIHPKNKKPVGHRLALCARNKIYGEDILSDAPEAMCLKKDGLMATIAFLYGEGLYMEGDALNAIQISADDINFIVDMNLKYNKVFSIIDIDLFEFRKWENTLPFFINVKKEGVVLWTAA